MAKRVDEYGDLELDDPSGYLLDTDASGTKFSLFHTITSHRLPPGINNTSGDDFVDDDSGIDVAGVAGKFATFSSMALGHLHPSMKQKHAAHEEYADLENIRANEIILEVGSNSQRVSLDDWQVGQSSGKQSGAKASSGGLKRQKSGGGGMKRAMTMPGSLTEMVSPEEQADQGLMVLKEKLKSIDIGDVDESTKSSGISFSLGGEIDAPEANPIITKEKRVTKDLEDVPKPTKGGLSRCKTMPGSLAKMREDEDDEETSVVQHSGEFAHPHVGSGEVALPTAPQENPQYKSTILSHFFARQEQYPVTTIREEDHIDSMKPIAPGSLTEKASHFSAADTIQTITKRKTKVRRRDLNMWAPGGT